MSEQNSIAEFDIHRVLRVLRRRKLIIIVLTVVVPLGAFAYSVSQPTKYTASATLLVGSSNLPGQQAGSLTAGVGSNPTNVVATNLKLVQLGAVANMTERALHRPIGTVSVSGDATTDLVTVSATTTNPSFAATIANTYATQYQIFSREQQAAAIRNVRNRYAQQYAQIAPSARHTPQAKSLLASVKRLTSLAALQTGSALLVDPATKPTAPSSPKTTRNVLLGLLIGLLLGLALAFLVEMLDRRVREPGELEEIFGRPVLATIPELRTLKPLRSVSPEHITNHGFEAFQMLRANLRYFNVDEELKLVLVTSALPGEGKTTVAWNLAVAAARAEARVLVIEADLRRPELAARIQHPAISGLSTLLTGEGSLESSVEHVSVGPEKTASHRRVATIDVLFAGPTPPNPADLLDSKRMANLLTGAKAQYDLVVVDTPPAAVVSDAVALVRKVDGVIVVCRLRKLRRESATRLHKQLDQLHARVIGLVVNSLRSVDAYGYESYEPYYSSDARQYLSVIDPADDGESVAASNGRASQAPEIANVQREDST